MTPEKTPQERDRELKDMVTGFVKRRGRTEFFRVDLDDVAKEAYDIGRQSLRDELMAMEFDEKAAEQEGFETAARSNLANSLKGIGWEGFVLGARWMFQKMKDGVR